MPTRLVVLTPDSAKLRPEHLFANPIVLYTPHRYRFIEVGGRTPCFSCCTIPTLFDVLGLNHGGGAPGFTVGVREPITEADELNGLLRHAVLVGVAPDQDVGCVSGMRPVGSVTSAGVILTWFFHEAFNEPLEEIRRRLPDANPLPLMEYHVPQQLKDALTKKASTLMEQLQQTGVPASTTP